ncbi:hypothetical protein DFH09DRAFT_1148914 [Mycena vulgaris]|nr:hypothetical protein DFH09DRAFT_1148914 [Mycena vulgaris]
MESEKTSLEPSNSLNAETDAGSPNAFFSNGRHFTVSGGQFTSVTNYLTNVAPGSSGLRMIPSEDLDLRHEICYESGSGIVKRRTSGCVRRVYSAVIEGRSSDSMTVAVYAGSTAEEEWQADLTKYYGLRHPHIAQIYGIINSCGIYATIFYGDLVPIQHFFWLYRDSAISTVYLHGYFIGLKEATTYLQSLSRARLRSASYTPWIRRSTGGLCIDLTPSTTEQSIYPYCPSENLSRTPITLLGPDQESVIISALTLHNYHEICYWSLSRTHDYPLLPDMPVHLGGIITGLRGSDTQDPAEIAYLPDCDMLDSAWRQRSKCSTLAPGRLPRDLIYDWDRFRYSGRMNIFRTVSLDDAVGCSTCCWLAQATHVLSRLQMASSYQGVVFASSVHYELEISGDNFPQGYIFMCPLEHLKMKNTSKFRHPEFPAYWSADQFGLDGMVLDEAKMSFKTEIWGWSWDDAVYAGLRAFHRGKGFDPDNQDVAFHLGLPLYQLSYAGDTASAHAADRRPPPLSFSEDGAAESDESRVKSSRKEYHDGSQDTAVDKLSPNPAEIRGVNPQMITLLRVPKWRLRSFIPMILLTLLTSLALGRYSMHITLALACTIPVFLVIQKSALRLSRPDPPLHNSLGTQLSSSAVNWATNTVIDEVPIE